MNPESVDPDKNLTPERIEAMLDEMLLDSCGSALLSEDAEDQLVHPPQVLWDRIAAQVQPPRKASWLQRMLGADAFAQASGNSWALAGGATRTSGTTWLEDATQNLAHPDAEVRAVAAESLKMAGTEAVAAINALLKSLQDPDPDVRLLVVEALAAIGDRQESVRLALVQALDDPHPEVAEAAGEALRQLG